MPTLGDMIEKKKKEYEIRKPESVKDVLLRAHRRALDNELKAKQRVEDAIKLQGHIEDLWSMKFGCECGLHGITCTHKKQGE